MGGSRRWAFLAAVVAIFAVAQAEDRAAAAPPRTLVALRHPLFAFAQDGSRIAWAVGPCGSVTIRDLATGRDYGFHGTVCPADGNLPQGFGALVLGGKRALWWTWWHGNSLYQTVLSGTLGDRARAVLEEESAICDNTPVPAIAADGPAALFSKVDLGWEDPDNPCSPPFTKDGGVFRLDGGKPLNDVPPAVALAVSGSLLALVPVDQDPDSMEIEAAVDGPVQVWNLRTLAYTSVEPLGKALAVAVTPRVLAVLLKNGKTFRIDVFDPRTARELRSLPVPTATAPHLSADGTRIVYRVGREIRLLDAASGKASPIATAAATPIGLSIEGARVAWGENVAGRGRIRALQLPR